MATFKVTTVMAHFSHIKFLAIVMIASFMLAVLVSLSFRDFEKVARVGQRWTPGYEKPPDFSGRKNAKASIQKYRGRSKQFLSKRRSDGDEEDEEKEKNKDEQNDDRNDLVLNITKGTESHKKTKNAVLKEDAIVASGIKNNRKQHLPNCLIIGFRNCGTSTLKELLSLHPDVATAQAEVQYFTLNIHRGEEWYRRQMPRSFDSQVTVEETPSYAMSPLALDRIRKFNASIKLILLVRDPIIRLRSDYAVETRKSLDKRTFQDWCGYVAISPRVMRTANFAGPIQEIFRRFPRKNVLVLDNDQVNIKPLKALREVEEFLGLNAGLSKSDFIYNRMEGANCFNKQSPRYAAVEELLTEGLVLDPETGCLISERGRRSHRGIEDAFYANLVGVCEKFNNKLFRIIGKRFDWISTTDLQLG
ncbi:heparan sulfate glucosamine 3-o-sulfotransferase 5 [Plakobranchus ocellatus]|uniref:Heparan sulfate glucosamine 3-o-sulfotransferase 5 n=1 Tax=Plakobranchus ocellatus TaxID=259542 RepID=A0AAV4A6Z3_9GAST|nr:heparan sulfate glucosamine 3-o-sulfotransferase 5 [Plakobranchus ocellatus]